MFGHQDDKKDDEKSSEPENVITPDKPAEEITATDTTDQTDTAATPTEDTTPATDTTAPDATTAPTTDTAADSEEAKPVTDTPSDDDNAWQHPGAPLNDNKDDETDKEEEDDEAETDQGPEPIKDIVGSSAGPDFKPFPQPSSDFHGGTQTDNTPHELIDIKAKALDDLTPLVDQLDQSPEDKFRTVMMMIQAKDDQSLIQSAYAAAHEIKDEKARAQALLDVVNEINYFTQHPEN